jgi:hypothetical protein
MNFVHFSFFSTLVDLCRLNGIVVSTLKNIKIFLLLHGVIWMQRLMMFPQLKKICFHSKCDFPFYGFCFDSI